MKNASFSLCLLLVIVFRAYAQDENSNLPQNFDPHVVFEAKTETTWGVYIADINRLETHPLLLIEDATDNHSCALLSPTHDLIAYRYILRDERRLSIHIYNMQTGEELIVREFLYQSSSDYNPDCDLAWSPDGQWLKFTASGDDECYDSYLVRRDASELRPMTDTPCSEFFLSWGQNPNHLFLHSDNSVYRLAMDNWEREIIYSGYGTNDSFTLNSSETKLAFRQSLEGIVILVDLSSQRFTSVGRAASIAFSPDGTRLVLISGTHAYIVNMNDEQSWQFISYASTVLSNPVWLSDNRTLFLEYGEERDKWLTSITIDYGQYDTLQFLNAGFNLILISHEEWLVFTRYNDLYQPELYRMRPDGSRLEAVDSSGSLRVRQAYPY